MKNVIILGASGNIASHVIDILVKKEDIDLTLFLRNYMQRSNYNVVLSAYSDCFCGEQLLAYHRNRYLNFSLHLLPERE